MTLPTRNEVRPAPRPLPSRSGTLPFDQQQRYRLIGELLRALRGDGPPLRVLDVGGRTGALRQHLAPDDVLVMVDPDPSLVPDLVLGAGEALPFRDESFDVVVAADTLEHVPESGRERFVHECCRVSRRWTVLAGPYDHPRVAEAERCLAEFVRERLGAPHLYLEEHLQLGLPDRARVEGWCKDAGVQSVRSLGHGNLERWLGLMSVALLLDRDPATRDAARRLHQFYNQALLPEDHAGCVYRHAVVAVKNGPLPPTVEELLSAPDPDPLAEAALSHALAEMLAFDRNRDVLHAERARLEGEIARRDADLDGHARTLSVARKEAREQHDCLRTALDDLAGHRRGLSDRDDEIARLRTELDQVRDEAHRIESELVRKTRLRRRFWSLLRRRNAG